MFLTAYNLPQYLVWKGLVTPESLVDGDLVIAEAGRRNRNFKVIRRKDPGLFVKQMKSMEPQAIATLRREAAFYQAVGSDPKYADIGGIVPTLLKYDEQRNALTLGLVTGAESLAELQSREGIYGQELASLVGNAVGRVHERGALLATEPTLRPLFTFQPPWPLMLDQTGLGFLDTMGRIGPHLSIGLQQTPNLLPGLSALRSSWQFDSLIHGDMKWDNCLVRRQRAGDTELTIVDWELADIGDGAWDVAGIFKEYIVLVLLSTTVPQPAVTQAAARPTTLVTLQPSIRSFWQAYVHARALQDSPGYLERAVKFTAARMIIAVLEYLFTSDQLGALGTLMLQTSSNILQSPQVASTQLVGSPGS